MVERADIPRHLFVLVADLDADRALRHRGQGLGLGLGLGLATTCALALAPLALALTCATAGKHVSHSSTAVISCPRFIRLSPALASIVASTIPSCGA